MNSRINGNFLELEITRDDFEQAPHYPFTNFTERFIRDTLTQVGFKLDCEIIKEYKPDRDIILFKQKIENNR